MKVVKKFIIFYYFVYFIVKKYKVNDNIDDYLLYSMFDIKLLKLFLFNEIIYFFNQLISTQFS